MSKPSVFSWVRTEDSALGLGAYSLLVGLAATCLLSVGDRGALGSLRAGTALCFFLAMSCLGVALVLQVLLRRRTLRVPLTIAGTATLGYALADSSFRGLFGRHLVHADLASGVDAVRTGAFPLSVVAVVRVLVLLLGFALASYLLLAILAWLPGPRLAFVGARTAAAYAVFFVLLFFRDLWWSGAGGCLDAVVGVHRADQAEERIDRKARNEFRLGPSLQDDLFAGILEAARREKLAITAERTPDILFVHTESLRADHFRSELFAETFARTKSCFLAPRHYATGNTTPNGIFGALTGLSPLYFERARKDGVFPLPLRALREIGYTTHVWYPNEALDFDRVLGTVIGPNVELHRVSREPVDEADALTVERFATKPPSTTPRFDYVVLDSSHYDYSYPSAFERFTPSGTLGLRFNPRTGEGLETSGPRPADEKVHNRYKNSLLYVDTLLARLIDVARRGERPVIIVIFGDHGESFWENGVFGHSTELSEVQTRVPALFCFPTTLTSNYRISSHADFFPTIFDWMGLRAEGTFMTGKSLLQFDHSLDWAIARGPVTAESASRRYLIVDEQHRTEILQTEPPVVHWVQDLEERELSPAPRDAVAQAFAVLLQGALLRSPEVRR